MEGCSTTGDARGWKGMQRAATALAAVHTAGLAAQRHRPIQDELLRFQKRAAKIKAIDAAQGERMAELARALPAWVGWLDEWGAKLSLIHGDCKPSQFLISDDQVAILDFDHAGMADPANDVGTFLATLRQLAVRQSLKAHADSPSTARAAWLLALEGRFLDEYCGASGSGEGFHMRAIWYEAVGLLRKALRSFGRSPFSPLPVAMVAEAWNCLADLPPAR
jgi:aminoglycoside phosphotransferase (APT) family kinase protein